MQGISACLWNQTPPEEVSGQENIV